MVYGRPCSECGKPPHPGACRPVLPRLTDQQMATVRLFRALTVPAPPEDDGPDPDYGF